MAISAGNILRVILGRISDLSVVINLQGRSLNEATSLKIKVKQTDTDSQLVAVVVASHYGLQMIFCSHKCVFEARDFRVL